MTRSPRATPRQPASLHRNAGRVDDPRGAMDPVGLPARHRIGRARPARATRTRSRPHRGVTRSGGGDKQPVRVGPPSPARRVPGHPDCSPHRQRRRRGAQTENVTAAVGGHGRPAGQTPGAITGFAGFGVGVGSRSRTPVTYAPAPVAQPPALPPPTEPLVDDYVAGESEVDVRVGPAPGVAGAAVELELRRRAHVPAVGVGRIQRDDGAVDPHDGFAEAAGC